MAEDSRILTDVRDGVALLSINRPQKRNAFDTPTYDALAAALGAAAADDAVRVAVVTGVGQAFSAGQDLAEMGALAAGGAGGEQHGFPHLMDALSAFDKPLLAAVNGVGVGIGFTMLLHCDLVYFAEGARLRLPFVPLGVVPEAASSYLLPIAVGWQRAAELIYTGRWIDAAEAVALGLGIAVYPADRLLAAVLERATAIASAPLAALRESKRLLLAARASGIAAARAREDAAFARRIGSIEHAGAIAGFLSRRS
ncbi:MAG TPA: enoyl-CoA hydratase-related protein [Candidatus Limnocylindria bacterium]|nr:enoyl-CoA hydratase-related protein [Candidatus Limnocylindria bacterium]